MRNTEFKTDLRRALHHVPVTESEHLAHTQLLVRQEVQHRRRSERIPFGRFLARQVRYIGWPLWSVQGLLLLLFDRMLVQRYGVEFWDSPTSTARLLFCISTLVAMIALPLLYRSRKYRMQEIESASYFSSVKLLLAKLAVIGLGDILLLTGLFLTTTVRTSMGAGHLTFYLLLPFLVMSAASLYMMGHCSSGKFFIGSLTLGSAMLLLAMVLPGRWLPLFQQGMTPGWLALFGILLVFAAEQLRYLLCRSPYAELQVI